MHSDSGSSKYAEFASPNSIDKVKLNNRGEMCLIRNFHNLADNENEDNNKRMDIYDKTKQIVYTYDLSAFDKVLSYFKTSNGYSDKLLKVFETIFRAFF